MIAAPATVVQSRSIPVWKVSALLLVYTLAYAAMLFSFALVWLKYPQFMYVGRDGDFALWSSQAYEQWGTPFGVTAINPLQGMVSMLVPINPYLIPGEWTRWSNWPHVANLLGSFSIYFVEVALSTFALGRALEFSRVVSFLASIWLALLLFPPFNFMFGLQGWFATAPLYAHTVTLGNLILIAFLRIREPQSSADSRFKVVARNWFLATGMFVLILLAVFAAPFYNAGMLLGVVLVCGAILFASKSAHQFLWRLLSGVYIAACAYVAGFFGFYLSAKEYSLRLSGESSLLPRVNLDFDFAEASLSVAKGELCNWGVACEAFSGHPWPTINSYWLHAAVIAGGVIFALRSSSTHSRIGLTFSLVWMMLLIIWVVTSVGVLSLSSISPAYFFLLMYPLAAFFSLHAALFLCQSIWSTLIALRLPAAWTGTRSYSVEIALVLALGAASFTLPTAMDAWSVGFRTQLAAPLHRGTTPIGDLLEKEISLHPGEAYRGSVATIFGTPGGSFRAALGIAADSPLERLQFERFLSLSAESGSTQDMLDFWWRNIPTLSEYGQGVSLPLMFYMVKFLSSKGDARDLNFALPRLANIEVLRAMGVRFIVADLEFQESALRLRRRLPVRDGAVLYLYEIGDPNLGSYSPTRLESIGSAQEFFDRIRTEGTSLKTHAFVKTADSRPLVAVEDAKMIVENGGIRVIARSAGSSALLLPIQFSHCYRISDNLHDRVAVMRANVIHTLVLFEKDLDFRLRWQFNFLGNGKCRRKDLDELRNLGLPELLKPEPKVPASSYSSKKSAHGSDLPNLALR